jgi:hypothetical protein
VFTFSSAFPGIDAPERAPALPRARDLSHTNDQQSMMVRRIPRGRENTFDDATI